MISAIPLESAFGLCQHEPGTLPGLTACWLPVKWTDLQTGVDLQPLHGSFSQPKLTNSSQDIGMHRPDAHLLDDEWPSSADLLLPLSDLCVWVDPLDGTKEFTEGRYEFVSTPFATQHGLRELGTPPAKWRVHLGFSLRRHEKGPPDVGKHPWQKVPWSRFVADRPLPPGVLLNITLPKSVLSSTQASFSAK